MYLYVLGYSVRSASPTILSDPVQIQSGRASDRPNFGPIQLLLVSIPYFYFFQIARRVLFLIFYSIDV